MATLEERKAALLASRKAAPAPEPNTDVTAGNLAKEAGHGLARGVLGVPDIATQILQSDIVRKMGEVMGPYGLPLQGASLAASRLDRKPSEYVEDVTGDITSRVVPKGDSRLADAVATGSEWLAPVPPLFKGAKLLSKYDAIPAAGAVAGEQLAHGTDYQDTAELVGGLGAGVLPAARGILGTSVKEADKQALQTEVADTMLKEARDPQQALANIRAGVEAGEVGDIADLAQDKGIANVLAGAQRGSEVEEVLQGTQQARRLHKARQLLDDVAQGGEASVAPQRAGERVAEVVDNVRGSAARQAAQRVASAENAALDVERRASGEVAAKEAEVAERVASEQGASAARIAEAQGPLAKARERLASAERGVEPLGTKAEMSAEIAKEFDHYRKSLRENVTSKPWADFESSVSLPTAEVVADVTGTLQRELEAPNYDAVMRRPEMRSLLATDGTNELLPRDIHAVASRLKASANDVNMPAADKRPLQIAADAIDKTIAKHGDGALYENAKEATKRASKAIGGDAIAKALRTSEPEVLGKQLMKGGEEGAVTARSVLQTLDDPEFPNAKIASDLEEYMLARLAGEGVDDKSMAKYEDMLTVWSERRPEFKARLNEAIEARQSTDALAKRSEDVTTAEQKIQADIAKDADKEVDAFRKVTEADSRAQIKELQSEAKSASTARVAKGSRLSQSVRRSTLASFAEAPKSTLRKAINAESPRQFDNLARAFKQPEHKRAFAAQIGEVLYDDMKKGGLPSDPDEYKRLVERLKGVIGEEGVGAMARAQAENQFQSIKKLAAPQSSQANKVKAADDAKVTAATYLVLGGLPINSLIAANGVRRMIRRVLVDNHKAADAAAVNEALVRIARDPQVFLDSVSSKSGAMTKKEAAEALAKGLGLKAVKAVENVGKVASDERVLRSALRASAQNEEE